ncbi:MAG: carboxypeptidase regulatory-like domain-containing protein [Bacteroidota bacterium]|nr:carboxypeptidase regulatory-like domain-containing protein [Bacteroidota bacterium]
MKRNLISGMTTAVLLFVGAVTATAQMHPDFFLNAKLESDGHVDLEWTAPTVATVQFYIVYRADLTTPFMTAMPIAFTAIDTTNDTSYLDFPHSSFSDSASFAYYIAAHVNDSVTLRSNVAVINHSRIGEGEGDHITITSTPPTAGEIGVEYTYQVVAHSSDSTATLAYRLDDHPFGMNIDSTGLITWTPAARGWYEVELQVRSDKGGEAEQNYMIRVGAGNGTVAGTISDSLGNPIRRVFVQLFQRDRDDHFEYSAITDSLGMYSITKLDPGTYFARAVPLRYGYLPQWYNGARSRTDATPITVADSATTTVNFVLQARAALPKFTVQGAVTDSANAGISTATIFFVNAGFALNSHGNINDLHWFDRDDFSDMFEDRAEASATMMDAFDRDFRMDGSSHFVTKVKADASGKYSVTLAQGSYVAFAVAPGYQRAFFNGQSDLLSANVIVLNSDTTGINFTMKQMPPLVLGQINGSVIDSASGNGVGARIIAYRDRWTHPDTIGGARTFFSDADSTGNYSLTDLPPGDYIVFAVPLGNYVPSFYSTSGPTLHWKEATKVTVNGTTVAGINIYVKPAVSSAVGYTSVYGQITINVSVSASLQKTDMTAALSGGVVYALDANGGVAGYGFTTSTGDYTIVDLAPGTYTISTEAPGYVSGSSTASPTYDASGNSQPANASYSVSSVTQVDNPAGLQPSGYALEQNYPNPFNPSTQIVFSIPQDQHVTIAIYNILGQKVATLVDNNLTAGAHAVTWAGRDGNGLVVPSGIYLYKISTTNFTAVKKMLLLK